MRVDALTEDDWPEVHRIYEAGIASGDATFETAPPDWDGFDAAHRPDCRLVAREKGAVVGWAALAATSARPVYAGVAEVSVYVAAESRGRGVGTRLLSALVAASEVAGVWTLTAGVFPENAASLRLHERCGFRRVGRRERPGQVDGIWRDVLLLERRSAIVGND